MNQQEKDIKRRYIGRVEVNAARSEIERLISQGYPYAWIFEKLQKEGKVSISYRQFCRCMSQYVLGKKVKLKHLSAQSPRQVSKPGSGITSQNQEDPQEQEPEITKDELIKLVNECRERCDKERSFKYCKDKTFLRNLSEKQKEDACIICTIGADAIVN